MAQLVCPDCGKELNPTDHGALVCDGEVYCDGCRLYDRELIRPRELAELQEWSRRLCQAFGFGPVSLEAGEGPPPAGPFDFLENKKLLLAEADHRRGEIILYPPGCRLATLCHELAHLLSGQEHTIAWARTFAALVAWVKARLPQTWHTAGIYVNLLENRKQ